MIAREPLLFAALSAAFLCVSCAVTPGIQTRRQAIEAEIEAILRQPLDTEVYGTTQRCLSGHEYRNFRVIDDRHILFEDRRGRLWINTLHMRCPDLRHATVLRVRPISSMGRICDMDTFVPGDWFTWPWYRRWPWQWGTPWSAGITCSLGKFQPVTEAQVEAIKDALRSR